jgi:prepilin-type processing-associated H-X9-DG protein
LPFVEQQAIFDLCVTTTERDGGFVAAGPGYAQYEVVPVYLCPSEPNPRGPKGKGRGLVDGMGGPTGWGVSNYAANYYVFGSPSTPDVQGARTTASLRDGASNLIVFTERYANCTNTSNMSTVYTSLWSDSTNYWRPVFCINNLARNPTAAGYPPCAKFQITPDWFSACDASRAQSPHSGGINACLGDGSVRFISGGIADDVWAQICDPRDGVALPGEW